jgi:hypothetical protein
MTIGNRFYLALFLLGFVMVNNIHCNAVYAQPALKKSDIEEAEKRYRASHGRSCQRERLDYSFPADRHA